MDTRRGRTTATTLGCRRRSRRVLLALGLALGTLGATPAAHAAGPSFALQSLDPVKEPYFVLDARPGATITRQVRVANVGDRAGGVRLYAVDATTGATTGAVYRGERHARRGVGRWVQLSRRSLQLQPGQRATVRFTIRVPRSVRPGDHLGGIVAENRTLQESRKRRGRRGSLRIRIRNLTVLAVQLDLPGRTRERLTVTSAKPSRIARTQTLVLGLGNDGNRLVKGTGKLVVTHDGKRVRKASFPIDTFVPGTRISYPVILKGRPLPPGRYRAEARVRFGRRGAVRRTLGFTVSERQSADVAAGGTASEPPSASAAGAPTGPGLLTLVLGGLGLMLLGAGASAAILRRRTNPHVAG